MLGLCRSLVLITACGRSKEKKPQPAWRLYKSPRIRYLKKVADEMDIPFYILSAKYGLIPAEESIEPYDVILTEKIYEELFQKVLRQLKELKNEGVSLVLYYRGGARKEYYELLLHACSKLKLNFIYYGSKNMKDINLSRELIRKLIG